MKKFYRFFGLVCLKALTSCVLILASVVIMTSYYETEKEELFFEVMDYFNTVHEINQEQLMEQHGIQQWEKMPDPAHIRYEV